MRSKAFTLLELTFVLAIIGIMMAISFRFIPKRKSDTWHNITKELNNLVALSKQEAITKGVLHKLLIVSKDTSYIRLMRQEDDPEGKKFFVDVKSPHLESIYKLPKTVTIERVFVNGKEAEDLLKGAELHIVPSGMLQDCHFFVIRRRADTESRGKFILNPFMGKFGFE